jgi:NAD kinase
MLKPIFDKIVVVTKKTALEELIERFNTEAQARFYLEHMGASFEEYQAAHEIYHQALGQLQAALSYQRIQTIERAYLPNFLFGPHDVAVTLGPDGLVINTAKYLDGQPLVAFNPDPARIDGVLSRFGVGTAVDLVNQVVMGKFTAHRVTMASVQLNDGQALYAVNDLFIGARTHVSARYQLRFGNREENQSSSGIIVSTGAGSTGWLRSILTGAAGVVEAFSGAPRGRNDERDDDTLDRVRSSYRFDYQADRLCFSVREPFISRTSSAKLVFGQIAKGQALHIVSQMPQNGVIFSDGIESDFLKFDSGAIARITVADRKVNLVVE